MRVGHTATASCWTNPSRQDCAVCWWQCHMFRIFFCPGYNKGNKFQLSSNWHLQPASAPPHIDVLIETRLPSPHRSKLKQHGEEGKKTWVSRIPWHPNILKPFFRRKTNKPYCNIDVTLLAWSAFIEEAQSTYLWNMN